MILRRFILASLLCLPILLAAVGTPTGLGLPNVATVAVATPATASYDSDAQAYFDAIVTAGSSISTDNKNAWNTCVVGLKADSVWTPIAELYVFVGPADLTGALVKAKGSGSLTNVNFVSGDYSRTTGLVGNGSTKYLDTNTFASTLNNTSHTAYFNASGLVTTGNELAVYSYNGGSQSQVFILDIAISGANRAFRSGTFTDGQYPVLTTGLITDGSLSGVRRSSTDCELYQNGSSVATNSTNLTPSLTATNILLFVNTTARGRVAMIGAAMSDAEMAAFDARIATYIAAVQ